MGLNIAMHVCHLAARVWHHIAKLVVLAGVLVCDALRRWRCRRVVQTVDGITATHRCKIITMSTDLSVTVNKGCRMIIMVSTSLKPSVILLRLTGEVCQLHTNWTVELV